MLVLFLKLIYLRPLAFDFFVPLPVYPNEKLNAPKCGGQEVDAVDFQVQAKLFAVALAAQRIVALRIVLPPAEIGLDRAVLWRLFAVELSNVKLCLHVCVSVCACVYVRARGAPTKPRHKDWKRTNGGGMQSEQPANRNNSIEVGFGVAANQSVFTMFRESPMLGGAPS